MDSTQTDYRHGVLVGNWNEDRFGVQLLDRLQTADNAGSLRDHYATVQRGSYQPVAREHFLEQGGLNGEARVQAVDKKILFNHKGADSSSTRYTTTYNTTWYGKDTGVNARGVDNAAANQSKLAKAKLRWQEDKKESSRASNYHTSYQNNYNDNHSIRAVIKK